jgi:hypothetical protein
MNIKINDLVRSKNSPRPWWEGIKGRGIEGIGSCFDFL